MTTSPIPVHLRRNGVDPVEELARLRTEQPVSRIAMPMGGHAWLVTSYPDVRRVLGTVTEFSNRIGAGQGGAMRGGSVLPERSGFLAGYDPPEHTRLRRMLTAEFTGARMRRLRPRIQAIVDEHLDVIAATGGLVDLVTSFALPIPALVICELLGVPYADREQFQRYSQARMDLTIAAQERIDAAEASRAYMGDLVARQRRSPGDDLLGMLVREHGDEVDDVELTGLADLLLMAGHETTSSMLSTGVLLMLLKPDLVTAVRDPAVVDDVIEELLRYLSVVQGVLPRTALKDVVLSGQEIRAGELVMCSLVAANRDPAIVTDTAARCPHGGATGPDHVNVDRRISSHLAFGHGIHFCLGAPLARMELRIAYGSLFDRFADLRLAVSFEEVRFRPSSLVFAPESLPIAWSQDRGRAVQSADASVVESVGAP